MLSWYIEINYDRKRLTLKCEQVYLSAQIERIVVIGRNRTITIQGNRPFLEAKGLKQKSIDWKLVDGEMRNSHLLELIIKTVEAFLKRKDRPLVRPTKPYKT